MSREVEADSYKSTDFLFLSGGAFRAATQSATRHAVTVDIPSSL